MKHIPRLLAVVVITIGIAVVAAAALPASFPTSTYPTSVIVTTTVLTFMVPTFVTTTETYPDGTFTDARTVGSFLNITVPFSYTTTYSPTSSSTTSTFLTTTPPTITSPSTAFLTSTSSALSAASPALPPATISPPPNASSSSFSRAATIGVSVALPIVTIALGYLLYLFRRTKRRHASAMLIVPRFRDDIPNVDVRAPQQRQTPILPFSLTKSARETAIDAWPHLFQSGPLRDLVEREREKERQAAGQRSGGEEEAGVGSGSSRARESEMVGALGISTARESPMAAAAAAGSGVISRSASGRSLRGSISGQSLPWTASGLSLQLTTSARSLSARTLTVPIMFRSESGVHSQMFRSPSLPTDSPDVRFGPDHHDALGIRGAGNHLSVGSSVYSRDIYGDARR